MKGEALVSWVSVPTAGAAELAGSSMCGHGEKAAACDQEDPQQNPAMSAP